MSVPLPLPMPSPLVALPSSLVARRTITACHQKCTGEGEWAGLATVTQQLPPQVLPQPVDVITEEPLAIR